MAYVKNVRGYEPKFGNNCFLAETAVIVGEVSMGDNCTVWFNAIVRGDVHSITIGNNTNIQDGAVIHCTYQRAKTVIGNNVSIAQNVNIMTDSGPNASPFMQRFYPIQKGEVTIGDHAWIGAGVVIMPGVSVGRCSIVAGNSFVNTDVEPYSVYAGNPARLVKKLEHIQEHDR